MSHVSQQLSWRGGDRTVQTLAESVIFYARGLLPFVLFIVLPGVSPAVAGCIFPLLDAARVCGPRSAALGSAVITSVASLLFAPLFATLYVWTQPATEH